MAQSHEVSRVAGRVGDNPVLENGARVGYAVTGVLHLLIAWIAIQIAWFDSGRPADQSGALQTLAGSTVGRLTLWVAVLGFTALGLWQVANAVSPHSHADSSAWADRAKSIGTAVVYLALAWTSFSTVRGRPRSSKAESADFTSTLLQHTGGRLLVAVIGLAILGIGGYHVVKGWTKGFLQDLRGHPGTLATRAGVIGYVAKGTALGVVGVLLVIAALQNSASKATGLDGALRSLRQQAAGTWLLTAVALGLAAYGLYSFARARFARV
jgi:hypothetical protein